MTLEEYTEKQYEYRNKKLKIVFILMLAAVLISIILQILLYTQVEKPHHHPSTSIFMEIK